MKFKLQAGMELDLLTREELGEELDRSAGSWRGELSRNVRFPRFSARTDVVGGVWAINPDSNTAGKLGPKVGFIWSVMRLAVSGGGIVLGTDVWRAFVGENAPSQFVDSSTRGMSFNPGALVIRDGESLLFAGAGTGAGTDVTVVGQAIELPDFLAWQLL